MHSGTDVFQIEQAEVGVELVDVLQYLAAVNFVWIQHGDQMLRGPQTGFRWFRFLLNRHGAPKAMRVGLRATYPSSARHMTLLRTVYVVCSSPVDLLLPGAEILLDCERFVQPSLAIFRSAGVAILASTAGAFEIKLGIPTPLIKRLAFEQRGIKIRERQQSSWIVLCNRGDSTEIDDVPSPFGRSLVNGLVFSRPNMLTDECATGDVEFTYSSTL